MKYLLSCLSLLLLLGGCTSEPNTLAEPNGGLKSDSPTASTDFILGTWNIRKLGHGSDKDYQTLATIIDENFDMLVLTEVMQKERSPRGFYLLLNALGDEWDGVVTDQVRPIATDGNSEYYAVVFRKNQVKLCEGWDGLRFFDGRAIGLPKEYTGAMDDMMSEERFQRDPAFACFRAFHTTASGNKRRRADFMVAAYHARFDDGDAALIKAEVNNVALIFEEMREYATDAEMDFMVVGDFNLSNEDLEKITDTWARDVSSFTIGNATTINTRGEVTDNLYDHMIFEENGEMDEYAVPQVLDVMDYVDAEPNRTAGKRFFTDISDHLPIFTRITRKTDDD